MTPVKTAQAKIHNMRMATLLPAGIKAMMANAGREPVMVPEAATDRHTNIKANRAA